MSLLTITEESINDMAVKLVNESKISNMLFNAMKTKIMVAGRQNTRVNLQIDGEQIERVEQFKFLVSMKTVSADCTTEIRRRICLAKVKAVKLDTIWRSRHIKKALKVRLMKSFVYSVFLYRAESWTIKTRDRDGRNRLEMWCWRRLLGVSWREHRTNESILDKMGLMKSVARLKLQYFGHVVRGSAGKLSLTILEGALDGTRHQGAPRMSWIHNVLKWSGKTYEELKVLEQDR